MHGGVYTPSVAPPRDVCGSDDAEGRLLFRPAQGPPLALGIFVVVLAALGLGLSVLWDSGGFLILPAGVMGLSVTFWALTACVVALWKRDARRLGVAGLGVVLGALALLLVYVTGMLAWASGHIPY